MNILALFSVILSTAVFVTGLRLSSEDLSIFIDKPSMFIVFGGTLAATAVGFRINKLFTLTRAFVGQLLTGKEIKYGKVVEEMITVIDLIKKGTPMVEAKGKTKDYFLLESLDLIEDGILNREEVIGVLDLRRDSITAIYMEDANKLRAISKFPPAFGMIGTTIGMIVLLANLGGEDAMKMIGPAMGVCLITTLYGAAMANILLIPMAENLTQSTKELHKKNTLIIEGVKLIMEKASPILAAEKLNSFLKPSERVDWKKIIRR